MPSERAKATFEDERVKLFLVVVKREFGGECSAPDYAKTEAKMTQTRGGDFSSSFYEISIPCAGKNGLAAVSITSEFVPLMERPLNLTLSLSFRR